MTNQKPKSLALFDFDGTITTKDSFLAFLKFAIPPTTLILGTVALLPTLLKYKLGLLSNGQAKEKVFAYFFANWEAKRFKTIAEHFAETILPTLIKQSAAEKIIWHKEQGHDIALVSASFELYLSPWCNKEKIDLLGTQLEEKNGRMTGRFSSPNCHGPEKVHRIKKRYNLGNYGNIYAYGDSSGDLQMLKIANEAYYHLFT